jgi:large subunit ribosomal protein L15
MRLSDLKPARGAVRRRKRLGTGSGSGKGGTCGRGTKGQRSRAGKKIHMYFEGGQLPLHRRVPKVGFTPLSRNSFQVINIGDLAGFAAGSRVTPAELKEKGLIRKASGPIKLLATGELKVSLTIQVDASSKTARQKIEAAGGEITGRE